MTKTSETQADTAAALLLNTGVHAINSALPVGNVIQNETILVRPGCTCSAFTTHF
ncbi:MAG: hypothetical protein ACK4OH_03160 [Acidovorax temperans]|uniref:hypothetical protein n=1 Tax=Acidovorax temperans TaxID=80878 RepID=UPI0039194C01